jgi:hypothetical protein
LAESKGGETSTEQSHGPMCTNKSDVKSTY